MAKTKTLYMHTLDGRPATYCRNEQVCYANCGRFDRSSGCTLASSVAEIREQWKASQAWRKSMGFSESSAEHHYVRVEVPSV